MTTVAWREGMLAADSQTNSATIKGNWQKIFRTPDGGGVAFCGDYGSGYRFVQCLLDGREYVHRQGEDFEAIVMKADGSGLMYENGVLHGRIKDRFYALGSGAMAALGAMCAGSTARGAVQAAAQYDCFTGGRIMIVRARKYRCKK